MLRGVQGSGYAAMGHNVSREGNKEVVMWFRHMGKG